MLATLPRDRRLVQFSRCSYGVNGTSRRSQYGPLHNVSCLRLSFVLRSTLVCGHVFESRCRQDIGLSHSSRVWGSYLHHIACRHLQQNQRIVTEHALVVTCARDLALLTRGVRAAIAKELGGSAQQHVVVQEREGPEAAPHDKHVLLVQHFLGDLHHSCIRNQLESAPTSGKEVICETGGGGWQAVGGLPEGVNSAASHSPFCTRVSAAKRLSTCLKSGPEKSATSTCE